MSSSYFGTATSELAEQIQKVRDCSNGSRLHEGQLPYACIGGTNVCEDIRRLEARAHVVVGTPGRRVYDDMINHYGALRTNYTYQDLCAGRG
ncbi:hypothetical protein B566_EDAN001707 [Ephemera danica]|nr:hypothetical protein B566_EDAN001707 [Ephemera danica]